MDKYTEETKKWLDQRFKRTNDKSVYFAHQPIYGFRDANSGGWVINSYTITYQILKTLSHMQFKSLLDVGGAEGYTAALIKSVFNANVQSCDLSEEACKRAKEIFNVDGESVDIHKLPFNDNEFDVVICSETLEHVPDFKTATKELVRICKKAVVITVPHEAEEVIEDNIKKNIPHAHIHSFKIDSFDFLESIVKEIKVKKILSPKLNILRAIVESKEKDKEETSYSSIYVKIYSLFRPVFRLLFGKKSVSLLMELDDKFSQINGSYMGIVFVFLKDENLFSKNPYKKISASQIVNFSVPYHYLDKQFK